MDKSETTTKHFFGITRITGSVLSRSSTRLDASLDNKRISQDQREVLEAHAQDFESRIKFHGSYPYLAKPGAGKGTPKKD